MDGERQITFVILFIPSCEGFGKTVVLPGLIGRFSFGLIGSMPVKHKNTYFILALSTQLSVQNQNKL